MRKQTVWVPTRADTKPGYTVTEDGQRLEILDLESRGIVHPCCENKGADKLRSYCEADLRLCFRLCRLLVFLCDGSFMIYNIINTVKSIIETKTARMKQQDGMLFESEVATRPE